MLGKARHVLVKSPGCCPPARFGTSMPPGQTHSHPKLPMVASNGSGIPERLAYMRLRLWRIAR